MSRLQVSLFGRFGASYCGTELNGLELAKVQELFCYLLLFRDRPHPREVLGSLLWADTCTNQSRRYLSKALWQLQTALADLKEDNHILLVEPEWIQLNSQADISLDVSVFEEAVYLAQDVSEWEMDNDLVEILSSAIGCYQGDLLEGWYQDWCLCERERLQHLYLSALYRLMCFSEIHGQYEAGCDYGYKILRYDRAHEQTHRQMIRLLHLAGNRTDALRQYKQCQAILHEELGVLPAERTRLLYEQVREGRSIAKRSGPGDRLRPQAHMDEVFSALVSQLQQLRQEIRGVECSLQQHIGDVGRGAH